MIVEHANNRPIGIRVGATTWNEFFGQEETLITAGADADLWNLSDTTKLGVYFDVAGVFEDHTPYDYYGGGLDLRQYFANREAFLTPYVGVGVGYYGGLLHDEFNTNWNKVGGKAFIGLELRCGAFIEGNYTYLGKHDNRDLSRFGVSIGYRF